MRPADHEQTTFSSQLLAKAIDNSDPDNPTIRYERLKPSDTLLLSNFPAIAAQRLVQRLEGRDAPHLPLLGRESKEDEDLNTLIEFIKRMRSELAFITAPTHPALPAKIPLALFTAMTHYLTLSEGLTHFLTDGDVSQHTLRWRRVVDLSPCEESQISVIPLLLNHIWLGLSIAVVEHCISNISKTVQFRHSAPDIPMYTVKDVTSKDIRVPKENTVTIELITPYQSFYALTMECYGDEIKNENTWRFVITILDKNKHNIISMIIERLCAIENDINNIIDTVNEYWTDFVANMKHFAIRNPSNHCKWMKSILESGDFIPLSFSYSDLRKSLISLSYDIQTELEVSEMCNEYLRLYRSYIPKSVLNAIEQADFEIRYILRVMRRMRDHKHEPEKEAIKHMRLHPERFRVITPDQVAHALKLYLIGGKNRGGVRNEARDIREYVLQDVAKRLGRDVSKLTVRKLLSPKKSPR